MQNLEISTESCYQRDARRLSEWVTRNEVVLVEEKMSKISIRFYKDHKVRAVWDEEHNYWWFDGKKRMTDAICQAGVDKLARAIRNQQAMDFLDWFTYSDNTIDGQSRKKAYTLWESNLVADKDVGKVKALQQIHAYLFTLRFRRQDSHENNRKGKYAVLLGRTSTQLPKDCRGDA